MTEPIVPEGLYEARYLAFLETVAGLRPRLHRYCARMTGSVADGEDVVQEALFDAYRGLERFDDTRRLGPWLFRIAHHKCVDLLRRRGVREGAESLADDRELVEPAEPIGLALDRAFEHLVLALPPKERACVLLKDVLDHSLEEIADLVDTTVGGVKAALHRGRAKLAVMQAAGRTAPIDRPALGADTVRLMALYVDHFNRRDFDGLQRLIAADARVRVVDRFAGRLSESPYFGRYQALTMPCRLAHALVEGERLLVTEYASSGVWSTRGVVRLEIRDGRIASITDYEHCPWVLRAAELVRLG